jgi:hypothetical protein
MSSSGSWDLTTNIGALDPQVKEAEIVLTPNPKAIESVPTVDRIWGKEIVFSHVPLSRQDLEAAKRVETNATGVSPLNPGGSVATNKSYPAKTFGPVMERDLPDFSAIRLASGQVEEMPKSAMEQDRIAGDKEATENWMETNGMDIANYGDAGLVGLEIAMPYSKRDDWENRTADKLTDALYNRPTSSRFILGPDSLKFETNYTFLVKTREDRLGLLQMSGLTDEPRRVKLRYKMVEE